MIPDSKPSDTAAISTRTWIALWALALALRLPGIWLIPNADGDAYSYAETIGTMSAKMLDRTFAFADLFGFWLPLYQCISALIATLFPVSPLLAGKLVSSIAGAGSAVLVFSLTSKLSASRAAAWIAFIVLLLDPLHLFYSALSLTDVTNACLILASMNAAISRRWLRAAIYAAFAELVRVDAWILLLLLPALQLVLERRVSVAAILALLFAPALWFTVSYAARGDALAYFAARAQYVERYLHFEPARRGFAFISDDFQNLLLGANALAFPLALVAGGMAFAEAAAQMLSRSSDFTTVSARLIAAAYFYALLAFLAFAYFCRSQPVIWIRYGSIFFAIGLPLALGLLHRLWIGKLRNPGRFCLGGLLAAICAWQLHSELTAILPTIRDDGAHRRIAFALRRIANDEGWKADPSIRCFCDDPGIRVLSGLGVDRFVRTEGNEKIPSFLDFLQQHHVRYLVFARTEHSLPVAFFPELDSAETPPAPFVLEQSEPSPNHYGPDLRLYRIEPGVLD